jgi:hypothetical protein
MTLVAQSESRHPCASNNKRVERVRRYLKGVDDATHSLRFE